MACTGCNSCNVRCNRCNATCNGCYGCNNCNSCVTCNVDGCQVCQNCVSGCQTFCQYHQNLTAYAGSFRFSPQPSTSIQIGPNSGMFTRESWNAAAKWISKRADVGEEATGGSTVSTYSGDLFTATEFNRIASEAGGPYVSQNQLITASLFITLQNNLNNMDISSAACTANNTCVANCNGCNDCNVSCNVCNDCQTCNSGCNNCNGCNSCNGSCNTCNNGCSSCNSCVTTQGNTPETQ